MKIIFISSGNSIHVKKLANGLISLGHNVTLFTMPNHTRLLDDFSPEIGIEIMPYKSPAGYYLNAVYLRKMLKNMDFDVINSHYVSGYGTLARLTRSHPLSLAVFGSDIYEYPFKSRSNYNRLIKNLNSADIITSTSHVMLKQLQSFYTSQTPMFVTPFGVDLNIFKPLNTNKNDGIFRYGIIKKLEDIYGIQYLIYAFAIVLKKLKKTGIDNVRLEIYGRGTREGRYKEIVSQLELDSYVTFHGFINNEKVPQAYSNIDVACFPSEEESFGVAVVEAMACGVPIIASDSSGFTEVIVNNKTGYIVPKKDIQALADKMLELYACDKKTRDHMGRAGIDRVHDHYNFLDNLRNYEKILVEVVNKGRR